MRKIPLFVEYTRLVYIYYSWKKASFIISKSRVDEVVRLHMFVNNFFALLLPSPSCAIPRKPEIMC